MQNKTIHNKPHIHTNLKIHYNTRYPAHTIKPWLKMTLYSCTNEIKMKIWNWPVQLKTYFYIYNILRENHSCKIWYKLEQFGCAQPMGYASAPPSNSNIRGIVTFDRSTLKSHLCPIIHTLPKLHQYSISRFQVIVVKISSMGPRDLWPLNPKIWSVHWYIITLTSPKLHQYPISRSHVIVVNFKTLSIEPCDLGPLTF